MLDHWENTYGLGHNYILNLPPSKDGVITPKMAASAAAFGAERYRRYGAGSSDPDQPSECEIVRTKGRLAQWSPDTDNEQVLHFDKATFFDRVFLSEDIVHDGQLVVQYAIDVCTGACKAGDDSTWKNIVNPNTTKGGNTIGTHHIDRVNLNVTSTSVRLRLLQVLDAPVLPLISFRVLQVGKQQDIIELSPDVL